MQMDKLLLVTHQISETSYGTVQDSNALEGGGGGGGAGHTRFYQRRIDK